MADTKQDTKPTKPAKGNQGRSEEMKKRAADAKAARVNASKEAAENQDALNMGVPMLQTDDPADEPTGPEDALGEGPTRGDYSDRIGPSNYHPHQVTAGEAREDGSIEPIVQDQREFVEQGDSGAGNKGGVDSA